MEVESPQEHPHHKGMHSRAVSRLCQGCSPLQIEAIENCLSPVNCLVVVICGFLNRFSSADCFQIFGLFTRSEMHSRNSWY